MRSLQKSSAIIFSFYLLTALLPLSLGFSEEGRRISTAEAAKLGVGQNIQFVERLIHESVASRQILESDNQEAQKLREKAIEQVEIAKEAQSRGDDQAVADALHQAKTAIFKGMQLVGKKVVNEKKEENYHKKRQSLEALLEAHKRIVAEKGSDPASEEVESFAQTKLDEARIQADKGNNAEALNLTNSAYLSVKLSLTKLREGQTLVRSLNFETKEDEYRYELGRNDTHNMLVNTVLKEKRQDPRFGKMMDIPLGQAEKLRQKAEAEAAGGDFETAIKTMEESTSNIIKAIRMAGIFIPG
ncbi:hypothetical protein [Kaarinaea lacus]